MFFIAALAGALAVTPPADSLARHAVERDTGRIELARYLRTRRVPAFSRQTKLACNACHYGFPQLTPFGRQFKLNGYTMTGLSTIALQEDSTSRQTLALSPIAPISAMAIVGVTNVSTPIPGTLGTTTQFPQQLSLFAAAGISPKMGIFSQVTYTDQSGTFAIDNTDIRFASHTQFSGRDLLYGLTLHNNPTVQDVWNTTPAWGYPFAGPSAAPRPAASTLIEGALAQSVLGLGAYTMYNDMIYAEVTGYVAAKQGAALPLDSSATDTPKAISPYWRVALQHGFNSTYVMVGTFGLSTEMYPTGVTGVSNHYNDLGFDAQVEQKAGSGMVVGRATYIHESQTLPAFFAASPATSTNATNTLNTYKVNLSWSPSLTHTLTAGVFGTSGTSDALLYAANPVTGSANGSPQTQGTTLEFMANPWLNVRLGAQYVAYQKFNGGTSSYDLRTGGRSASDNNTLYLYLWLVY